MDKQLVEYLIERVEKIDEKVEKLLKFKWQIVGGSFVAGLFATMAFQILLLITK